MTLPVTLGLDRSLCVLLVDDRHLVRAGLKLVLEDLPQVGTVLEATGIEDAQGVAKVHPVDVVLLDNRLVPSGLGQGNAPAVTPSLGAPIIVMSAPSRIQDIERLIANGAAGFLVRNAGLADLEDALTLASLGGCFLCPSVSRNIPGCCDEYWAVGAESQSNHAVVREVCRRALDLYKDGVPLRRVAGALDGESADVMMAVTALAERGRSACSAKLREAVSLGLLSSAPDP